MRVKLVSLAIVLILELSLVYCIEKSRNLKGNMKSYQRPTKANLHHKAKQILKAKMLKFAENPVAAKSESMNEGLKIAIIVILCGLAFLVILFFVIRFITRKCQQESFEEFDDVMNKQKEDNKIIESYANPKQGEFNPYDKYLKKGSNNTSAFGSDNSHYQSFSKSKIRN